MSNVYAVVVVSARKVFSADYVTGTRKEAIAHGINNADRWAKGLKRVQVRVSEVNENLDTIGQVYVHDLG